MDVQNTQPSTCTCCGCELNYCSSVWTTYVVMDGPFYDCTEGTCPRGHQQAVAD
jgi:hypothetical protein